MGKSKKSQAKAAAQSKQAAPAAPAKRKAPILPATIAFVVILIAIAVIASANANRAGIVDGKISRTIATVDECASMTLPLDIPEGETIENAAEAIFDTLAKTTGVGLVTIFEDDPRVRIEYCQSYSSDPVLRDLLEPTGYIAP